MPSKRTASRDRIAQLIATHGWNRIDETAWKVLRAEFPRLSEETIRKHLQSLAVALDQPFRGVDTASLETLEATLNELTGRYRTHPRETRQTVIRAKDKTRLIARNPKVAPEKQALKSEMVEWMLVWLGDPALFPTWAALRKSFLDRVESTIVPRER